MRWSIALVATPVVAGLVIASRCTGALQLFEWATYDRYFQHRPAEAVDKRILLVTIDESDIQALGQWPLADATLAQLVTVLKQYQPAVIGLDIYRDIPVEPGHELWTQVMMTTPNLVGVEKGVGRTVTAPPQLAEQAQVALTDVLVDADGKVRRGLLSHDNAAGESRYGLGAELAVRYLDAQAVDQEVLDEQQKKYRLGQAVLRPFRSNSGGYIRTNAGGYQLLINFRGHIQAFHQVSLTAVLNNQLDPDLVRDRVVIIGAIAPSLNDLFYTPYSSRIVGTPEATAGMVVHANITSTLLSGALEGRTIFQVWAEPVEWVWILLWSGVGAFGYGSLMTMKQHSRRILTRLAIWAIAVTVSGGILIVSSYLAFLAGWWIPLVPPLLALVGAASMIAGIEILSLQQQRVALAQQNLQLENARIRAEAASQAKSQFLAKMSHELRTPLNAILGFTQLLNQDLSLTPQQKKTVNIISLSGEHLLSLINNVLEISQIEADRIVLQKKSFDLHALLELLKEMLAPKAEAKGLWLHFDYSEQLSKYVTADEGKLRQVLLNLLNNAIKFTAAGEVVVRVSEHALDYPKTKLHFEVADTGPGIKPDEVSTLFEVFTQGEAGQAAVEGAGLGLSISHQLVRLMGGELTLNTRLDEGTTFQFDILADRSSAAVAQPSSRSVSGLAPNQPAFRLLIAEDNLVSRKLLHKLLTSLGFQVLQATNGQEAVDLWESWQPHLIWMDMQMPVMNGCDATRYIRQKSQENHLSAPVIIALTANAFDQDRERSLIAGCDDFVSKPFRREELLDKLSEHLGVEYQFEEV
ncbi:MAG: CHASE2 domain-containing protein [Phormidesmis sp.]